MSKPSAPTPPDPKETAAAQTSTNVATALANAALKNVNQVTPYGNLTYTQTGRQFIADPNGQTYYVSPSGEYSTTKPVGQPAAGSTSSEPQNWLQQQIAAIHGDNGSSSQNSNALPSGYTTATGYYIPTFTATQTLSPEEQAIFNQSEAAKANLAGIASDQSAFLKDYLGKPADLDALSKATSDKLFQLGSERLDPRFAQEEEQLRTRLANQGIQYGSAAYDNAMREFSQGKNDAYNQLALTGDQQAFNEALTARQEPINEITALLSGSQVSHPNYVNTQEPTIPTTDYAGIVNQNYQDQMGIYNSQMQQSNALMGGMFSLLSAPLMMMSDRRLKTDIKKVGKAEGHNVYRFRYKAGGPMQLGLMAQEVERKDPDAVITMPGGMKAVDYGKALHLGA